MYVKGSCSAPGAGSPPAVYRETNGLGDQMRAESCRASSPNLIILTWRFVASRGSRRRRGCWEAPQTLADSVWKIPVCISIMRVFKVFVITTSRESLIKGLVMPDS